MTKLISEAEYLNFKEKLRSIIIKIIIGFVIGVVFGQLADKGEILMSIMFGVLFAGMPYAWSVIPVGVIGWVAILIKLLVAICLGWVITPIALIYNFIQMKHYEKAVKNNVAAEQLMREADISRENENVDKVVDAIHSESEKIQQTLTYSRGE